MEILKNGNIEKMKIEIKRWGDNDLYTEGQLIVNGKMAIPYTVEYHDNKVEAGTYEAWLRKKGEKYILYFKDESGNERMFIAGHSFKSAWKEQAVVVGDHLIPGAVYRGRNHLARLINRLSKAVKARKKILITFSEDEMQPTDIIKHWSVTLNLARLAPLDDAAAKKAGGLGHREEGKLGAVGEGTAVDGLDRAGQSDGEQRRATVEGVGTDS